MAFYTDNTTAADTNSDNATTTTVDSNNDTIDADATTFTTTNTHIATHAIANDAIVDTYSSNVSDATNIGNTLDKNTITNLL